MRKRTKIIFIILAIFVLCFIYRDVSIAIEMMHYGRYIFPGFTKDIAQLCFDNGIILPRLF